MDTPAVSTASTLSTKSSAKSSQSGHSQGEPKPPIDPPRRLSSLGFSQILQPNVSPSQSPQQADARCVLQPTPTVAQTPNVGRKRGNIASLLRSKPKSGHNASMLKIFQDAKAHLQLDMVFASSPAGSIESRLPSGQIPSLSQASSRNVSARQDDSPSKPRDWRYSTAPGLLARAHIDVREPFPEREPLLPDLTTAIISQVDTLAAEPVSNGFNSAEDDQMDIGHAENDPTLPSLPDTNPITDRLVETDSIGAHHSLSSPSQQTPLLTDLERPLTELNVNQTHEESAYDENVSPAIAYLQRQSASPEEPEISGEDSSDQPIFLSTPAKAAAESARAKRGLQRSGLRSTIDKENIPPAMICPDPSVHTDRRVTQCPDPRRHTYGHAPETQMSNPRMFGRQSGHNTPNPYLHNYQPSPSPLRASLYPPPRRADSSGSPLPVLKAKSPPPPPPSPGPNAFHQRRPYFSNGPNEYPRPPTALTRPPTGSGHLIDDADHFQPGWYHYPSETAPFKPNSLTYAFSTAAAKVVGSSQAPDLRIRDSYRTDTLTPLARPASRFRKNGIGVIAAREANRPNRNASYSPWPSTAGPGNSRPRTGCLPSRHGIATPDQLRFMSSPPRQSDYSACMPIKRTHPKDSSRDFDIAEDDTSASLPGTPMEIDEDIQAAVRMSISGIPDTPVDDLASPKFAEVRQLSPNVSPYRKGKGLPAKRLRTASYWDQDLPEVRRIDHTRMKRPATMEAGTGRVRSIRVSGIRSSPPRHMGQHHMAVASKSGTVASASIYSQTGMSEMSRLEARARVGDEKGRVKVGDVEMGEAVRGDDASEYTEITAHMITEV